MKSETGNGSDGTSSRKGYKLPKVSMNTGEFIVVSKQPKHLTLALAKKHGRKKRN